MTGPFSRGFPCWRVILACLAVSFALTSTGCRNNSGKIKVAVIGLTCEAPIFVAFEKGFFKDEGLDIELVKTDWDGLRQGLGLGNFDAIQTLLMYVLKPIEQGLDAKITGGIHTGCLRLQVSAKSNIKSPKDLKGKKIGIPTHLESPPHMFASRVLKSHGLDPTSKQDVTWIAYPEDTLAKRLEDGSVEAIAASDPIGTILVGMGLVHTIADQADDAPYCDEYCCVAVVSGKLAKNNPAAAAKITRAMMKAAKWVHQNSAAAAKLAVEKRYTATSAEINAQALAKLHYVPGVEKCRTSIASAAKEMQSIGLLDAKKDLAQLAKTAWLDLDGVSDGWLKTVAVERIPGGGRPTPMGPHAFALLCSGQKLPPGCCGP